MPQTQSFVLRIPLDASQVRGFSPDHAVKVAVWGRQSAAQQQTVHFDPRGKAVAAFGFEERPQESLRVALGPASATVFELQRLQTISVSVPAAAWSAANAVTLTPVAISTWFWWWWQHWKQSFRITGRVADPRGGPVAGATVTAFDVDAWWWWTAQESVGEAITDERGAFAVEFVRASGWSPWWWWATREWQANAELVGRITAFVGQYPRFGALAAPTAQPCAAAFEGLLATSARPMPRRLSSGAACQGSGAIDPAALETLRERLVEILPRNFPLPVWPWAAWAPWEDCGANLRFRVTDECGEESRVLLQEGVSETRWEIPAALDVTLTVREARTPKPAGWTLVDYLFPGDRAPLWRGSAGDLRGVVLGETA